MKHAIAAAFVTAVVISPALVAAPVQAQKTQAPGVNVGDQWKFVQYYGTRSRVPNRVWVIDTVTPEGIGGTENGEPLALTVDLNVLDSPRETSSNPKLLRFPMEVGDRWSYTSDWLYKEKRSRGRSEINVEVVRREKVRVYAGEFDAFKLEAKGTQRGVSGIGSRIDGGFTSTYWYAPAARAVVKSVSWNPYLGTRTLELVEYQLRP